MDSGWDDGWKGVILFIVVMVVIIVLARWGAGTPSDYFPHHLFD